MIKGQVKTALRKLSERESISVTSMRIAIIKENGHLNYKLMEGSTIKREITLKEVLNIKKVDVLGKEKIVFKFLHKNMGRLIEKEQLDERNVNVRLYLDAGNNHDPSAYLFNGGKAVKPINIDELLKD